MKSLRNLFIYQVYVRNHTEEGTFKALIDDLDRIKNLGVDVVYLLPIHEIGVVNKKGSLGCPYSIKDYYSVASELGTMSDFEDLRDEVHSRGMKLMMDIVFNHTSFDSVLLKENPEWFFYRDGELAGKVGDWTDITDLDFDIFELWDYLVDVLKYWTEFGVDGFRCDVASLIPLEFWLNAKQEVADINSSVFWLSESVHGGFVKYLRDQEFYCASEGEIYEAFDMAYDYDVHPEYEGYLLGKNDLNTYLKAIENQDCIYKEDYVKLRNVENHDFDRIAHYTSDEGQIRNWHGLSFFLKGATMVYAGGEFTSCKLPSLFDKDVFSRNGNDISDFLKVMASITKENIFTYGTFKFHLNDEDVVVMEYNLEGESITGMFNVGSNEIIDLSGVVTELDVVNMVDGRDVNTASIKREEFPIIYKTK